MATKIPEPPSFFLQCRASAIQLGLIGALEPVLKELYMYHKRQSQTVWEPGRKDFHKRMVDSLAMYLSPEEKEKS